MLAVNVSANTSDMCPITLYRHLDKKVSHHGGGELQFQHLKV